MSEYPDKHQAVLGRWLNSLTRSDYSGILRDMIAMN